MCPKDTAYFLTSPKIPDAKGIFVMIQFTPVGDSGVLAVCGSEISEQVNAQVMALDAAVQAAQLPGVVETVPTYAALLVTLDPLQTDADTLIPALRRLWDALPPVSSTAAGRLALSGSEMVKAAQAIGLPVANEVFADRGYRPDGSLVPRGTPGAMIEDEDEAIARVIRMVTEGKVTANDGTDIAIQADSVCVHGDGPKALAFVEKIGAALQAAGVELKAF